jgi:hypothetical protein
MALNCMMAFNSASQLRTYALPPSRPAGSPYPPALRLPRDVRSSRLCALVSSAKPPFKFTWQPRRKMHAEVAQGSPADWRSGRNAPHPTRYVYPRCCNTLDVAASRGVRTLRQRACIRRGAGQRLALRSVSRRLP